MKLCLGTVQLGMRYGIAGDPQPDADEAMRILDYAFANDITSLDTASSYGNSEDVIGSFLQKNPAAQKKVRIVTKTPAHCFEGQEIKNYTNILRNSLQASLKKLYAPFVESYLFHTADYAYDYEKLYALYQLKQSGDVLHCGISVYTPDEALSAINSGFIDCIQVPFNLFDHRFYTSGIFSSAKEKNIAVYCRSVYLQGLFVMDMRNLPPSMAQARQYLCKLNETAKAHGLSPAEMAMAFVNSFSETDKILVGVNSLEQLKDNVAYSQKCIDAALKAVILQKFAMVPPQIYLPTLWR